VIKAGDNFEVLATNSLSDQSFIASPIAVGNDLFLRSRTHLFRIGQVKAAQDFGAQAMPSGRLPVFSVARTRPASRSTMVAEWSSGFVR